TPQSVAWRSASSAWNLAPSCESASPIEYFLKQDFAFAGAAAREPAAKAASISTIVLRIGFTPEGQKQMQGAMADRTPFMTNPIRLQISVDRGLVASVPPRFT